MIYYVIKDGRSLSDYTDRKRAEEHAEQVGGYVETYIDTPISPVQLAEKYAKSRTNLEFFKGNVNIKTSDLERILKDTWLAGWDCCREFVRDNTEIKI